MSATDGASTTEDTFSGLVERHRAIVLKVAHVYAPSADEREDVAQEILLQLWRAFPRYDRTRRFSTWMYRVALNVGISYARRAGHRRRGYEQYVAEPEADRRREPVVDRDAQVRELERFIADLDELSRALVLLHLEDRPHREIAQILGISESNVGTRLSRLKQRMRRELAPSSPEG